jgi:hypothetical protein
MEEGILKLLNKSEILSVLFVVIALTTFTIITFTSIEAKAEIVDCACWSATYENNVVYYSFCLPDEGPYELWYRAD